MMSKMSRRGFLGTATALGTMALASCAAREESTRSLGAVRAPGQLPRRGEFIVKNAHVLTMDPKLGEIAGGDIHVRDGVIVALGRDLSVPQAEIDKRLIFFQSKGSFPGRTTRSLTMSM